VKVNVSGGLQCQLSPSDHQEDHFKNTTESQEVTVIHNHNEELDETAEKRVLSPNPLQKKWTKTLKVYFLKIL
jgi:ribosomal protein L13